MDNYKRTKLLTLAREAIALAFENKKPDLEFYKDVDESKGCFVTLHRKKQLRGCIGYIQAEPLYELVPRAAVAAALYDDRFKPVTKDELELITIEISLLTEPKQITGDSEDFPKNIIIGEDGLIIQSREGSGLLLPQVAAENFWDAHQFLNALCQKAGVSFQAWKEKHTKIFKFQTEIFRE